MSKQSPARACVVGLTAALSIGAAHGDDNALATTVSNPIETLIIIGDANSVRELPGAGQLINQTDLERFRFTDINDVLRDVPGLYLQTEDGLGLRPNIGIRGTGTDRSGRVTLLEDGVLSAPAPYAASSAYYFPTAARMSAIEVIKGPAAIRQGPYTIGGAVNFLSTPIPDGRRVDVNLEGGSWDSRLGRVSYGDSTEHAAWLLEGLQMDSDGFKDIDRSARDTGYDIQDYVAKLRLNTRVDAPWYHEVTFKYQYSEETSEQSYLGLTDRDFGADPYRMYGLSELDEMNNEHEQRMVTWRMVAPNDLELVVTAYDQDFERAWFKTEGIDLDGAATAGDQDLVGWLDVIDTVNRGGSLTAGNGSVFDSNALQAILDGTADTAPGSLQLRNNSRTYFSRGVQARMRFELQTGDFSHAVEVGARWHEDQEDRLQRNSAYSQVDGALQLDDLGIQGNAGNRVQDAEARSMWIVDTITWGDWTFSPGLRLEDIELSRTRYFDVPTRTDGDLRDARDNEVSVWLPGLGVHYELTPRLGLIAGVHKGFSTPTNDPGTREEESINYELGLRYSSERVFAEVIGFWNDYDNLLGICTNSSGGGCQPGDVFNGDAITVRGVETRLRLEQQLGNGWRLPITATYTYTDGQFDTDIADPAFFGDASAGDPLPYVPEHQFAVTAGLERGPFAMFLRSVYIDETCVQPSCGAFGRTDDNLTFDVSGNWQVRENLELYALVQNITDAENILGRQPYGARPDNPRLLKAGVRVSF